MAATNIWKASDGVKLTGLASSTTALEAVAEAASSLWEYSQEAINLIADYQEKFPMLFKNLAKLSHQPKYSAVELLGKDGVKVVDEIIEWQQSQRFFNMSRTLLSSSILCKYVMSKFYFYLGCRSCCVWYFVYWTIAGNSCVIYIFIV